MSKVYCENCKKGWYPDDRAPVMCGENILTSRQLIPYCDDLNANNDCSYYKRKWWKFWASKEWKENK